MLSTIAAAVAVLSTVSAAPLVSIQERAFVQNYTGHEHNIHHFNETWSFKSVPLANLSRPLHGWEVVMSGEGRHEVIHNDIYDEILKARDDVPELTVEEENNAHYDLYTAKDAALVANGTSVDKRCARYISTVIDKTSKFVDWDTLVSPIVQGVGDKTQVVVAAGYQIADAVAVNGAVSMASLGTYFGSTLGITLTRTWTTSYTASIFFPIEPGMWGAIVFRANVVRRTGRTLTGCVGAMVTTGSYTVNSHTDSSAFGLKWVDGYWARCQGTKYPLARCQGGGTLGN